MSIQLLDKTRKINKLLHNNHSHRVEFSEMCGVLGEVLESNMVVVSGKGKILGAGYADTNNVISELINSEVGGMIDKTLNERILGILSTKENVNLSTLGFSGDTSKKYIALIVPAEISGERLGTLFIYRTQNSEEGTYGIEDIILSEYGTTVFSLEIMRAVKEEDASEKRKKKLVKSALNTLSLSEREAIKLVFDELDGSEGMIVASRIAEKYNITRSVIVNALKKFESAGVINTKSAGMKGTHIKVANEEVFDAIKRLDNE